MRLYYILTISLYVIMILLYVIVSHEEVEVIFRRFDAFMDLSLNSHEYQGTSVLYDF